MSIQNIILPSMEIIFLTCLATYGKLCPLNQMEQKMDLCIRCKKKPITNKGRQLCSTCYKYLWRVNILEMYPLIPKGFITSPHNHREILFIKNYFTHNNWEYQFMTFQLDKTKYTPDFYDRERDTHIEVSGTKQAYFQNKDKYQLFRETFPKINFEIRNPDGEIIDESKSINSQI